MTKYEKVLLYWYPEKAEILLNKWLLQQLLKRGTFL